MNVWVVLDEMGQPEFVGGWPEACHEHIKEVQDMGPDEAKMAAAWVVREYTPVTEQKSPESPP